jgi:hypothetical protein
MWIYSALCCNSIQFFIINVPCQQLNANYRHSTVYILVIQYSQIIIVLLILIQLKQMYTHVRIFLVERQLYTLHASGCLVCKIRIYMLIFS